MKIRHNSDRRESFFRRSGTAIIIIAWAGIATSVIALVAMATSL